MPNKMINLRVPEEWDRRASNALNVFGKPLNLDRSELIRQAIDQEEILYCHSPYIAASARHFVLVQGNGDLHYWAEEELRIFEDRRFMPLGIGVKPPVRKRILRSAESLDDIRGRWLVHYFAARDQGQPLKAVRADAIDELGIFEKNADLEVDRGPGVPLIRERLCVFRDFVRETEPRDASPENASIPVEIPTLNLRIYILVDRGLYEGDPHLQRSARLSFDFRNLDTARFQRHILGFGANESSFYGEVFPESEADHQDAMYDSTLKAVQTAAQRYLRRLNLLATPDSKTLDGQTIIKDPAVRDHLRETSVPTSYLFGEFRWAKPYVGTVVNVTWNRPSQPLSTR